LVLDDLENVGFGADNFDQTVEVFDLKVVERA